VLSVEDEVVAFDAEVDGNLLAQQDESEEVTMLQTRMLATLLKVNAPEDLSKSQKGGQVQNLPSLDTWRRTLEDRCRRRSCFQSMGTSETQVVARLDVEEGTGESHWRLQQAEPEPAAPSMGLRTS
jgi:hypothetical protein